MKTVRLGPFQKGRFDHLGWVQRTDGAAHNRLERSQAEATNFRGRDKELSPLTSQTLAFSVAYEIFSNGMGFLDKGTVNISFDRLMVGYDEFRDPSTGALLGDEPLYHLDANIYQLFFSFWY